MFSCIMLWIYIPSLWQKRQDEKANNAVHADMPCIDDEYYLGCTNCKDDVIIARLRKARD